MFEAESKKMSGSRWKSPDAPDAWPPHSFPFSVSFSLSLPLDHPAPSRVCVFPGTLVSLGRAHCYDCRPALSAPLFSLPSSLGGRQKQSVAATGSTARRASLFVHWHTHTHTHPTHDWRFSPASADAKSNAGVI